MAHSKCAKQRTAFVQITPSLGLTRIVACFKNNGTATAAGRWVRLQFMPTTWQDFKRITKITGNNPPNPWEPKDAFVAVGLYLSDLGADLGTREAERKSVAFKVSGWVKLEQKSPTLLRQ